MRRSHSPATEESADRARAVIGVFDSGVGGLSILLALRRRLPSVEMIYVGDVAHAPYGDRRHVEVIARCVAITGWLIDRGAAIVVVACNTATALAIEELRARWPAVFFVGVEPGIKPAVKLSNSGRIAVMATSTTASSPRLRALIERHADGRNVHVEASPGLAFLIENGTFEGPALLNVLTPICARIRSLNVDVVVLGCTHFPFVAETIGQLLGPDVALVDTAVAVAEQAALSFTDSSLTSSPVRPPFQIWSTGKRETMTAICNRHLELSTGHCGVVTII